MLVAFETLIIFLIADSTILILFVIHLYKKSSKWLLHSKKISLSVTKLKGQWAREHNKCIRQQEFHV